MTDNLDLLTGKVLELLDKVEVGLINVAPHAAELVLNVVRVNNINSLVLDFAFLAIAIVGIIFGKKVWKIGATQKSDYHTESYYTAACIILTISTLTGMIALMGIFNVWNWVGVFQPELRLAKDLYDSMLGAK